MFEAGDVEGIKAYDLKQFIRKRLNEKLVELGYVDLGSYFSFDEKGSKNLDWFYHLTGVLLILIFLLLVQQTTAKQVKEKILKIYGKLN
jgi:hypothetical protein